MQLDSHPISSSPNLRLPACPMEVSVVRRNTTDDPDTTPQAASEDDDAIRPALSPK